MIDTIRLWLNGPELFQIVDLQNHLSQFLTGVTPMTYNDVPKIKGYLKNLRVIVRPSSLSITGSLSKFKLGNNTLTLTPSQIKEAIEEISDSLNIDAGAAKITRLDASNNLVMDHPPSLYYPYLGACGRMKRLDMSDGIQYQVGKRQLVIYDKQLEMTHKRNNGSSVPENFKGKDLLRIELRLLKDLSNHLKIPEIRATNLSNNEIFHQLIDNWHDQFSAIQKRHLLIPTLESVASLKSFEKFLMASGIQALGGEHAIEGMIQNAKTLNLFSNRMNAKRLKDRLKSLCQDQMLTTPADPILELETKMKLKVQELKSII